MRRTLLSIISILATASAVVACGGGGSGNGNGGDPYANITPNPYPQPNTYAVMPNGFASAIPSFMSSGTGLQIAYGYNTNPFALDLVAGIAMQNGSSYVCSATPIASDGQGGTWLIGAAHCYVASKSNPSQLISNNLLTPNNITVSKGVDEENKKLWSTESAVVYLQQSYCQGGVFNGIGKCPKFEVSDGGQGNDIALIHINRKFNISESYPTIDNGDNYPQPYTMAPVLSLGYGDNNVNNLNGQLFYVVNYFYQQSDATGYHYLYNSYFNPSSSNFGYSALICGGDSGGGDLFWNGSNWILLSEHTYGPSGACGQFYNYLPNAATNVSAYYDWIQSIIGSGNNAVANCQNGTIANCVTNG